MFLSARIWICNFSSPDLFVIPVIDLVKYGFIDYRTFQQKMDQVDLTIEQGSDLYCELYDLQVFVCALEWEYYVLKCRYSCPSGMVRTGTSACLIVFQETVPNMRSSRLLQTVRTHHDQVSS